MVADNDAAQRLFTLIQESFAREKQGAIDTELKNMLEIARATSVEPHGKHYYER